MKNLKTSVLIAAALLNPGLALAAKCEFTKNTVDEATGERFIQTDFDPVLTKMSAVETDTNGSIAVILTGGQKYLAVRLDMMDYYPLPDHLAGLEDPSWDPTYRDFLDSLLGDATIFPDGSTARLDLDDQTSLVLTRDRHLRVRTNYALPGENPYKRDKTQKKAKKLVGFLAKAMDADIEVESDVSRHYAVSTNVILKYAIDAEAEAILKQASVTGMRIEARDRYYTLAWRSTSRQIVGWNSKSYPKIRAAMQCVDNAARQ